jgi:MFS family permease
MVMVKRIRSREASAPGQNPFRRFSHAWRALQHRNFRLFFIGQSISLIGTWMTRVATSWLVYRLTGSALLLGVVGFAGQIPTFLLAPFAGVLVDRLDRRKLLIWTQALAALQSLSLAGLTLARVINIHEVIWLSMLQGLINTFDMPGRQAFLVQMVEDKRDLGNAIALNSSMVNMARLVGPALAGIVIGAVGEGYCFAIDGISYLAVIASLLMMRVRATPEKRTASSMLEQLKEGWAYVSGFPPIRTILLLFALVSLMGMPFMVLMPIFASDILHGGPHTLGFLLGASGVGCSDFCCVACFAQDSPWPDHYDSDLSRTVRPRPHRFWFLAKSSPIDVPHADRRLWHDAGYGRQQHSYTDARAGRYARPSHELLHHGFCRNDTLR